MLRRSLGTKRWISLIILTLGVSIVSLPQPSSGGHADPAVGGNILLHDTTDHFFPRSVHELGQAAEGAAEVARELTKRAADGLAGVGENVVGSVIAKRSASYQGIQKDQDLAPLMNYSIGLSAVLVAAVASGLAGVYFEKMLKDSPTPASVWTRNIQLSFYSLFPALAGVIFKDGEDIARHGFFEGYNWVVWTAIVFQAFGGVLASLCINYADNIAKNFAASISIIISFLFSVWFFNFEVNFTVGLSLSLSFTSALRTLLSAHTVAMLGETQSNLSSSSSAPLWYWPLPTCTAAPTARDAPRQSPSRATRSQWSTRPTRPRSPRRASSTSTLWNRCATWVSRRLGHRRPCCTTTVPRRPGARTATINLGFVRRHWLPR